MEINRIELQRTRMKCTQQKLNRLMPFDEWCRTVNPTESAKEIYEFVRLTLERELERSKAGSGRLEGTPHSARRRPRTSR
jgi:hypothetical protein